MNKQASVASRCFTSVYLVEGCSGCLHCFQLFFVSCVFSLLSVDVSKGRSFRIFGKNVKFFISFRHFYVVFGRVKMFWCCLLFQIGFCVIVVV